MAFKFYIDSQLTDQPVNDTALSTTIKRDNNIGGMVVTQDVRLIYNGNNDLGANEVSGYTILKDAFDSGTCSELVFNIYDEIDAQTTLFLYAGIIKVPDIEINEQRIEASVEVQDNSFYAYINNNKSIEYNVQSLKTKSREDITPPDIYNVDCFESISGIYGSAIGAYFRGYRVYDVFKYIVGAISDNNLSFESFTLQEEPELFIFDGYAMANPNTDPNVIVSFSKLFDEVNKIKNIAFYIDTTDQLNPVLRIERKSDLYSASNIYTFDDLKELTDRINTDRLYGTIRVGADDNPGGAALVYTFESGISYLGWKEEFYTPLGQCNIDNELNLVNEFGITSNDVHDQLLGAVSTDLDKLFLIECDNLDTGLLTADATQYASWISTPDYYYNQGTNNPSKLINHGSNYQTGLTNTLEIGGNGFQAQRGQDQIIASYDPSSIVYTGNVGSGSLISPIVFTDETSGSNYDGGGNYDNTTGIYIAPLDGVYSFNSSLIIDAVNIVNCSGISGAGFTVINSPILNIGQYDTDIIRGFIIYMAISVYTDATLTVLVSQSIVKQKITQNLNQQSYTVSNAVNLTTGQAVIVNCLTVADAFAPSYFGNNGLLTEINNLPNWSLVVTNCPVNSPYPTLYITLESVFKCTGAPDGGGITIENDPALYKNKEYQFTEYISQTDFQAIKSNPTGLIYFEKDGLTRYGWIQDLKRNDWTGQAQIKLISDNAST